MFPIAFAETLPGLQGFLPTPNLDLNPFLLFFNGLLGFLSPCILPMLPLYVVYVMGENREKLSKQSIFNLSGLIIGFVILFAMLGALGGLAGGALSATMVLGSSVRRILDIIANVLIIVFGLMMMGIVPGLSFSFSADASKFKNGGFFKNIVFGFILVLSWAPCLTPTLGLALTAATQSASAWKGIYALSMYALGLSLPLAIIMLLFQKLTAPLNFLKSRTRQIRILGGILMIAMGVIRFF